MNWISEAYTVAYRRGFPRPVAFSGHAQLWRRDDVFAYRDGGANPEAEAFALQEELLFTADIARLLGVTTRVVATRVRFQGWQRGFQPMPLVGRKNVEDWIGARRPLVD